MVKTIVRHALVQRGLEVDDLTRALRLLESVGYYRVTGYLYPFLESEKQVDDQGQLSP